MNINPPLMANFDPDLVVTVMKILNTKLYPPQQDIGICDTWPSIIANENSQVLNLNEVWSQDLLVNQTQLSSQENMKNTWSNSIYSYKMWKDSHSNDSSVQCSTNDSKIEDEEIKHKDEIVFSSKNFENYKQLKRVAKKNNLNITKEEIYEKLLMQFKHEKVKLWNSDHTKFKFKYICKYGDCNKEFDKIWNMINHVRMHENIKPYLCKKCGISFTQK